MQTTKKQTVLAQVRKEGEWKGWIAPSNVNSWHINNGWCLGMELTIVKVNEKPYVFLEHSEHQFSELETFLDNYRYHNCQHNELGKRVRFWNN